jgi:hypothetical protein
MHEMFRIRKFALCPVFNGVTYQPVVATVYQLPGTGYLSTVGPNLTSGFSQQHFNKHVTSFDSL